MGLAEHVEMSDGEGIWPPHTLSQFRSLHLPFPHLLVTVTVFYLRAAPWAQGDRPDTERHKEQP